MEHKLIFVFPVGNIPVLQRRFQRFSLGAENVHLRAGILVLQVIRRVVGDDFAVVHNDVFGTDFCLVHVVGSKKNRHVFLLLEPLDVFPHIGAGLGVQAGGGFVQEQHLWVMDQPSGNLSTPFHATGQTAYRSPPPFCKLHQVEGKINTLPHLVLRHLVESAMIFQIFLHGHLGVQSGILKDNADILSHQTAFLGNVMSVDGQRAIRLVHDGTQGVDGRAFSRAVGTEERENTAFIHGEGNVVHRRKIPVPF